MEAEMMPKSATTFGFIVFMFPKAIIISYGLKERKIERKKHKSLVTPH